MAHLKRAIYCGVRMAWYEIAFRKTKYWLGSLGWFYTALSVLVGVIGGIAGLIPNFTSNPTIQSVVHSAALALIAVGALAVLAWREMVFNRRRKFANALPQHQAASERLVDLCCFLQARILDAADPTKRNKRWLGQARKMLEEIADDYAAIYSMLTGVRCRMCVKLVDVKPDNTGYVFTLARDRLSSTENRVHDKRRQDGLLDRINDNSDFLSMFEPDSPSRGYFFSEDLAAEENYRSSSINYWQNVAGNPNIPYKKWCLPYRSTIVWPIQPSAGEELGIPEHRCIGFLAVDSQSRGAFEERWDAPFGKALACNMYVAMVFYRELDGILSKEGL